MIVNTIGRTFFVVLSFILLFCIPVRAQDSTRAWTVDELGSAFDEVARNYGAVEYATYTFMVEFARAPDSLDELRESGHLNVLMTNPYTGGDVLSLEPEDYPDGDLAGNLLVSSRQDGYEAHLEAWYVRRDDTGELQVHSMVKRISLYQSEIDYEYFFNNDLPRDEQFVAVYCRQAIDAIESFVQRNGRSPDNFADMYWNGDVNVSYVNPVTGSQAESTDDITAGDFFYERIGEDGFILIGWGRIEPVFFATTDDEAELEFYEEWADVLEDGEDESEGNDDIEDCDVPERQHMRSCK